MRSKTFICKQTFTLSIKVSRNLQEHSWWRQTFKKIAPPTLHWLDLLNSDVTGTLLCVGDWQEHLWRQKLIDAHLLEWRHTCQKLDWNLSLQREITSHIRAHCQTYLSIIDHFWGARAGAHACDVTDPAHVTRGAPAGAHDDWQWGTVDSFDLWPVRFKVHHVKLVFMDFKGRGVCQPTLMLWKKSLEVFLI